MHFTSFSRRATLVALAATLAIGISGSGRAADFPALNAPATGETHPGKFVWAELFTADPAAATKFYTGVFGWTSGTLNKDGVGYTVFSNGTHPVAGLRRRSLTAIGHSARWVHYIAVADINGTLALATKAGATIRAPARPFPDLGSQAIITDVDGSPVGLIQSTSGDSADTDPVAGDWNWVHLFVKQPATAAEFYRTVFNYETAPDSRPGKSAEWVLSNGPVNRGGISVIPDREDAKPGWLGVIRVADLDATLALVPGLGGEVMVAPHEAAFGSRFAVIADPTGGTVGLVQYLNNVNPVNHP